MSDVVSPPATAHVVRFSTFALDRERHQLVDGDREVHLSPKAYDLLDVFLSSAPRALSKADLHARLWPDTFVSDANLTSLVAELRAALGDCGREGRYIRTVHGFGYAFAAGTTETPPRGDAGGVGPLQWLVWGDRQLPLDEGQQVLGRDVSADVVLDSLSVSRRHARITVSGARVTVEDLGSKNGTWKRGERLAAPTPLEDGDRVRLGSVEVVFRTVLDPGGTQTDKEP